MRWYAEAFRKYATFSGRARRKEYWMFVLINTLVVFGLAMVDGLAGLTFDDQIGILSGVYVLATLLPALAVGVRRLHDTDRSGWWLLLGIVPLVGALVLLLFNVQDGTAGANEYGESPKAFAA